MAALRAAEEGALAYMASPGEHWTRCKYRRIYSTNPLERLNVGSGAAARSGAAPTWPPWSARWGRS